MRASAGVAPVEGQRGLLRALREADAALYTAKARGRDRVVVAPAGDVVAIPGSRGVVTRR